MSQISPGQRYVLVETSHEAFKDRIAKDANWQLVVENHHGSAYWNSDTGEFAWLPDDAEVQLMTLYY